MNRYVVEHLRIIPGVQRERWPVLDRKYESADSAADVGRKYAAKWDRAGEEIVHVHLKPHRTIAQVLLQGLQRLTP